MIGSVLVTGGTGVLGRRLIGILKKDGFAVRVASRRPADDQEADYYPVDLVDGFGLKAALDGVDAVVHLASGARSFNYSVDTIGTRRLVRAAGSFGIQHMVYVSIVGIDRIPLRYYRRKLLAERMIRESGTGFSILRATQFHDFIDEWLRRARIGSFLVVPKSFKVQPVGVEAVARRLSRMLKEAPLQSVEQMGGPEIMTLGEMAESWLDRRHLEGRVVHLPLFGRVARGFRAGWNTCDEIVDGSLRWEDWLSRKYNSQTHAPAEVTRMEFAG